MPMMVAVSSVRIIALARGRTFVLICMSGWLEGYSFRITTLADWTLSVLDFLPRTLREHVQDSCTTLQTAGSVVGYWSTEPSTGLRWYMQNFRASGLISFNSVVVWFV